MQAASQLSALTDCYFFYILERTILHTTYGILHCRQVDWEYLQLQVALLYNSETSGIPLSMKVRLFLNRFWNLIELI